MPTAYRGLPVDCKWVSARAFRTGATKRNKGSGNRSLRQEGPNLDQRNESVDDVLFAIRNGGFSGAIMPQNILTGPDATSVAKFVSKYAGSQAGETPQPGTGSGSP